MVLSKTFSLSRRIFLVAATTLGLAACGGGANSGSASVPGSGPAGVNLSMQLKGVRSLAQAPKAMATKAESSGGEEVETKDASGTPIALTEVRVSIRDVEFQLPDGMHCEDVQFTFVDPVRCDHGDADENEAEVKNSEIEATPSATPEAEHETETGDNQGGDNQGGEDKVIVDGPFIADLIQGTSTPSLSNFLIPAGNYQKIDVRIEESKAEDGLLASGDPLLGNSLFARGTFDYQGVSHELRVILKFNEDVRFENDAGIPVQETGANDVVLSLDEQSWFQGIDLVSCLDSGNLTLEADGSLVLAEGSGTGDCAELQDQIKDNIKASGSGFRDENDDHGDNNQGETQSEGSSGHS